MKVASYFHKPSFCMCTVAAAAIKVFSSPTRHSFVMQVYKPGDVLEEAIAEVEVVWAGKAKFQLLIKPLPKIPLSMGLDRLLSNFIAMRVGVSDLYLSARVRIALTPLMGRVPVVGAMKVRVCGCACVRACVCVCMCECARVCVRVHMCVRA